MSISRRDDDDDDDDRDNSVPSLRATGPLEGVIVNAGLVTEERDSRLNSAMSLCDANHATSGVTNQLENGNHQSPVERQKDDMQYSSCMYNITHEKNVGLFLAFAHVLRSINVFVWFGHPSHDSTPENHHHYHPPPSCCQLSSMARPWPGAHALLKEQARP